MIITKVRHSEYMLSDNFNKWESVIISIHTLYINSASTSTMKSRAIYLKMAWLVVQFVGHL